jgi:hypothetical protein
MFQRFVELGRKGRKHRARSVLTAGHDGWGFDMAYGGLDWLFKDRQYRNSSRTLKPKSRRFGRPGHVIGNEMNMAKTERATPTLRCKSPQLGRCV